MAIVQCHQIDKLCTQMVSFVNLTDPTEVCASTRSVSVPTSPSNNPTYPGEYSTWRAPTERPPPDAETPSRLLEPNEWGNERRHLRLHGVAARKPHHARTSPSSVLAGRLRSSAAWEHATHRDV